jgi:hypothetical protein
MPINIMKEDSIPEQFKNDTKETQLNNDKFSLWFYENCEVDVKI